MILTIVHLTRTQMSVVNERLQQLTYVKIFTDESVMVRFQQQIVDQSFGKFPFISSESELLTLIDFLISRQIMKLEKVIFLICKILMLLNWIFITTGKFTITLINYLTTISNSLDLIPFIGQQDCIFDVSKNSQFNVFKSCLTSEKGQ